MPKKLVLIFICLVLAGSMILVGCTPAAEPATAAEAAAETQSAEAATTETEATEVEAAEPEAAATDQTTTASVNESSQQKVNIEPAAETPEKPLRIATVSLLNNPFWFPVKDGVTYAQETLADKNTTVDFIAIEDYDIKQFSDAIETAIAKEYDAITCFGFSDALVPVIDKAVDAGIIVNTFNSEGEKPSKRTAFFGQDLFNAGEKAGEIIAENIGGEGSVAIITGSYGSTALEQRRKGALKTFENYPDITVVGESENEDKAETAYSQTKDFLTAHPDLSAIYVTGGGPFGAAKAIEELGLTDQVKLVCFDFVDETIQYVRTGVITATIGQDPFGQGYDPIVYAYNQLVTGEKPPQEKMWTRLDVVTEENVDDIIGPAA